MKTIVKAGCLFVLLSPASAMAADFGYLDGGYAPGVQQRAVVERRIVYPPAYPVTAAPLQRREIVIPAQRPTRVIEQRIVEGPGGVTKTTRIYEHSGPAAVGYGPRPPRDIPLASYPYPGGYPRVVARPILAPGAGAIIGADALSSEAEYEEFE
ncbi:MAG: hypothetical protein K2Y29_17860 [Beijerinckiaceae bacterium]|nr:hypothetical protein [Beijerinckiaceae bacterium]